MKKKIAFKIRQEDLNLRNEMHFEVQRRVRATVQKPRKGRGSFSRKQKHKKTEEI